MIIQDHQTQPGLQTEKHQVLCACPLGKPKLSPASSDRSHAERLKFRPSAKHKGWVRALLRVPLQPPGHWGHQRTQQPLPDPIPTASLAPLVHSHLTPGRGSRATAPGEQGLFVVNVSTPMGCGVYPERRDLSPCEGTEKNPTISTVHMEP